MYCILLSCLQVGGSNDDDCIAHVVSRMGMAGSVHGGEVDGDTADHNKDPSCSGRLSEIIRNLPTQA